MIGGQLLDRADGDDAGFRVFLFHFLEDDEMPHQVEQCRWVQHAVNQGFELANQSRCFELAIRGFPRHETAQTRRQRSGFGFESVGYDQQAVVVEQAGNDRFIGLQLLVGRVDGGVFIDRVLEFDHHQWKAIDKQDHVGTLVLVVFDHGELIGDDELVVFRVSEVDQPHQITTLLPLIRVTDLDAFGQHAMKGFVIGD